MNKKQFRSDSKWDRPREFPLVNSMEVFGNVRGSVPIAMQDELHIRRFGNGEAL